MRHFGGINAQNAVVSTEWAVMVETLMTATDGPAPAVRAGAQVHFGETFNIDYFCYLCENGLNRCRIKT